MTHEGNVTGLPGQAELRNSPGVPGPDCLETGPVAYIECVQDIPCNPCEAACPFGAITVGQPITNLPRLNAEQCTGCGRCIALCPGLAIFTIHQHYSTTTALVAFPYEYVPLPQKGECVPCGDNAGQFVTTGTVVSVKCPHSYDQTAVVSVEVPKAHYLDVRTICRSARTHDA